jgi:uncharacterized protein involved in outer membrane biogenesis
MKRLIRWAIYLFIIVVALAVAGILLLNTMVKQVVQSRLRTQTGMDVRIGEIDVGLLSPTITIENFKLYNGADFGGSLFLDMPELHLEYDPLAVRAGQLHFKLVRLNLAEVAVIQDKKGRFNVQDLERKSRGQSGGRKSPGADFKFTGIDTLNLTLGKFRLSNLASGREQVINFGIKDQITRNVRSEADLAALNVLLALRAGASSSGTNSVFDLTALLTTLSSH